MTPRNICDVIDAMLAAIPEDKSHLRAMLAGCRDSSLYTAPESMSRKWWQAAEIMSTELGPHPHAEPWQQAVCDVFTGKATP